MMKLMKNLPYCVPNNRSESIPKEVAMTSGWMLQENRMSDTANAMINTWTDLKIFLLAYMTTRTNMLVITETRTEKVMKCHAMSRTSLCLLTYEADIDTHPVIFFWRVLLVRFRCRHVGLHCGNVVILS